MHGVQCDNGKAMLLQQTAKALKSSLSLQFQTLFSFLWLPYQLWLNVQQNIRMVARGFRVPQRRFGLDIINTTATAELMMIYLPRNNESKGFRACRDEDLHEQTRIVSLEANSNPATVVDTKCVAVRWIHEVESSRTCGRIIVAVTSTNNVERETMEVERMCLKQQYRRILQYQLQITMSIPNTRKKKFCHWIWYKNHSMCSNKLDCYRMIVDPFPERLLLDIPAIERRTRTRTSAWTLEL